MAQWVSANLANLLPGSVDAIFDSIRALTSTVSVPLTAVKTIMNKYKLALSSLPAFDFVSIARGLVEDFKEDLIGSGYYVLDMWDYPVKQLQPATFGFDQTYSNADMSGHLFSESFQQDLINSFDDTKDVSRPQFSGNVAMLVIVVARGTLDDMGVDTEEDHIGEAWKGFDTAIHGAARAIEEIRWKASFGLIRSAAEVQESEKVATRVARAQRAFRLLTYMTQEELDLLPKPLNPETGEAFFEGMTASDIDWEEDIVPILEAVESNFEPYSYPDWQSSTLYDVYPELADLVNTIFDPVIELLESGGTIVQSIIDLIDAITAKLNELQRIIDDIDVFLEQIEDLLSATGFHAVFISSSSGVEGLKTELENATDFPFSGKGFYAGMSILVGSDAVAPFTALFQPVVS